MLIATALLSWSAVVVWIDWRRHRIPNVLLVLVLVPEIVLLALRGEGLLGHGIREGATGAVIAAALFLPGFVLGLAGGGDVKLGACCGLILGSPASILMVLVAALSLGAASARVAWNRRRGDSVPGRIAAGPALILGFAGVILLRLAGAAT